MPQCVPAEEPADSPGGPPASGTETGCAPPAACPSIALLSRFSQKHAEPWDSRSAWSSVVKDLLPAPPTPGPGEASSGGQNMAPLSKHAQIHPHLAGGDPTEDSGPPGRSEGAVKYVHTSSIRASGKVTGGSCSGSSPWLPQQLRGHTRPGGWARPVLGSYRYQGASAVKTCSLENTQVAGRGSC